MPLQTNKFGNIEVNAAPKGTVHVPGLRLTPLCRKLKIQFAPALVGFKKYGSMGYKAQLDGVIIFAKSKAKLEAAIKDREFKKSNNQTKSLENIRKQYSEKLVAQALYVLNKYAKIDKSLYEIKNEVLKLFQPTEIHSATFQRERRDYIIRSNYDDDMDYDEAIEDALRDEKNRPYISLGIESITHYYLYYLVDGFGFHSPIRDYSDFPNLSVKSVTDNEPLVTPRGIDITRLEKRMSLKRAKMILEMFLENSTFQIVTDSIVCGLEI